MIVKIEITFISLRTRFWPPIALASVHNAGSFADFDLVRSDQRLLAVACDTVGECGRLRRIWELLCFA